MVAAAARTRNHTLSEPRPTGLKTRARWPYVIEVARVLDRHGAEVLIDIGGRQSRARIAIPPPTSVDPGDLVIVIGSVDCWWAVGRLGGFSEPGTTSPPAFEMAAGLTMHAPQGRITITASRLSLGGGTASIVASTLRAHAQSCLIRCQTGTEWVSGCVRRVLGGLFQRVEGAYHRRSREVAARAMGPVVIKGERVRFN